MLPARLVVPLVDPGSMMSVNEYIRFERFKRLASSKFIGALKKDAYNFLINCQ